MADKQDAIALLKADHRKVEDLFEQFEKARGEGRKQKIALEICLDQISHAMGEDGVAATAIRNDLASEQMLLRPAPHG
jgi:hypothetical protein